MFLPTVQRKRKQSIRIRRFNTLNLFIKTANKIWPVLPLLFFFSLPIKALQQQNQVFDRWDPTDEGMKTGPGVGETVPKFQAMDQYGRLMRFQDITGPNGALILIYRSADW
jgi:hypothetical protein